jgi:hypothetical protein
MIATTQAHKNQTTKPATMAVPTNIQKVETATKSARPNGRSKRNTIPLTTRLIVNAQPIARANLPASQSHMCDRVTPKVDQFEKLQVFPHLHGFTVYPSFCSGTLLGGPSVRP